MSTPKLIPMVSALVYQASLKYKQHKPRSNSLPPENLKWKVKFEQNFTVVWHTRRSWFWKPCDRQNIIHTYYIVVNLMIQTSASEEWTADWDIIFNIGTKNHIFLYTIFYWLYSKKTVWVINIHSCNSIPLFFFPLSHPQIHLKNSCYTDWRLKQ